MWRNSEPPLEVQAVHALDIVSCRAATLGLGACHPVWRRQLDTAQQHGSRIRHLHLAAHVESRGVRAVGFSQSGVIGGGVLYRRQRAFAARFSPLARSHHLSR